ncbi:MAG: hypothetical protein P4L46_13070 [Fimbriimonas sp.]|nr:hypothetical protein [Fimbriimonas sp.]
MSDQTVWADTTDGGLLKQLYGYYPTLHDAVVRSVDIDRSADTIRMVLDYNDMLGEDRNQHLSVRICLEWAGIVSFDLPIGDHDLYYVELERENGHIVTSLGAFGSVVSEGFEAILIQIDPGEPDDTPRLRYQ